MADINQNIEFKIKAAVEQAEAAKNVGELKKSIKELQALALQTGDVNSEAFKKTTIAAGQATDKINDLKSATKSLSGSNVENLSNSFQGLKSNLLALDLDGAKAQFNNLLTSVKGLGAQLVTALGPIGLTVAGIAALAAGIIYLISQQDKLTESQKRNLEISEAAIKKDGEQIAQLQILGEKIKEGNLTQVEKTRLLKEYNEKFGETLGSYKTYQELEKAIISNLPNYVDYLVKKAKAEAAYALLVKEQTKVLEAQMKDAKTFTGFSIFGTILGFDSQETFDIDKNRYIQGLNKGVNVIKDIYTDLTKEVDDTKKKLNITPDVKDDKKGDTKSGGKSKAEIASENEIKVFRDKVLALNNLNQEQARDFLLTERDKNLLIIEGNIGLYNELLKSDKLTKSDRIKIQSELNTELNKKEKERTAQIKEEEEERIKVTKEAYDDEIKINKESSLTKINTLKQEYLDRKISQNEYNNQYDSILLTQLQDELIIRKKYGQSTIELESQIYDALIRIRKKEGQAAKNGIAAGLEDQKKTNKSLFEQVFGVSGDDGPLKLSGQLKETIAAVSVFADEAINILGNVADAAFNKKNKRYQDSKRELEELKAADEEYASKNNGLHNGITQNQIANLEKRAASEKEAAKKSFETTKKIQIAAAIVAGLKGVLQAWTSTSVLPKPFDIPLRIVETVAVIATTAATISKIKSQQFESDSGSGVNSSAGSQINSSPQVNQFQPSQLSALGQSQIVSQNGQATQQVFVVESDITRTQNRVRVTQNRSILGR